MNAEDIYLICVSIKLHDRGSFLLRSETSNLIYFVAGTSKALVTLFYLFICLLAIFMQAGPGLNWGLQDFYFVKQSNKL